VWHRPSDRSPMAKLGAGMMLASACSSPRNEGWRAERQLNEAPQPLNVWGGGGEETTWKPNLNCLNAGDLAKEAAAGV
jgi:hypothetical protein